MALSKIRSDSMTDTAIQSNKNLIINGGMIIAARGTSSTSSGYGTVDRTKPEFGGASVTQSQQALTSGGPYDDGHRYFLRCANTSASSATNAYLQINQEIEAQNVATSGWNFTSTSSYVTMSFWARSSLAGTYYVLLKTHDGSARSYSSAFTLVADTWKKIEVTVSGNSNITINTDNGHGLRCYVVPYLGTDFTTSSHTSNAWQGLSSTDFTPDFAQNWANTANATFDLTGWMVEVGTSASPFEHEDIGTTLRKCQRYYVRQTANNAYSMWGAGFTYTTQQAKINIAFPVEMRDVPSLGQSANNTLDLFTGTGTPAFTQDADINNPSTWATNVTVYCGSGLTVGQGAVIMANNNSSAYLEFKAEL